MGACCVRRPGARPRGPVPRVRVCGPRGGGAGRAGHCTRTPLRAQGRLQPLWPAAREVRVPTPGAGGSGRTLPPPVTPPPGSGEEDDATRRQAWLRRSRRVRLPWREGHTGPAEPPCRARAPRGLSPRPPPGPHPQGVPGGPSPFLGAAWPPRTGPPRRCVSGAWGRWGRRADAQLRVPLWGEAVPSQERLPWGCSGVSQ